MKKINSYESMKYEGKIRLNGNESSRNLDSNKLSKIVDTLNKLEFNRYPESENEILKEAYANHLHLNRNNIIVGNGSDEMIALVIGTFINRGEKILTLNPDFSMYDFYVNLHEGELIKVNCNDDGSFDINDFISVGKKNNVDLIIFSNPNNPTGHALSKQQILTILNNFKDTTIVIDEAYYEFYGESIIDEINNYENLLVTRTMSKAWGAASLRVGFLIGNEKIISYLESNKVPYNVNSLSQVVGRIILEDEEAMRIQVDEVKRERERVLKALKKIEKDSDKLYKFYDSKANYIFGRSVEKDRLLKVLDDANITIRNFNDDSFRITIGNKEENDLVLKSISSLV